jgi:colicin import membrane protein
MTAVHAAERFEFAPPAPKGLWRGLGFALLAHACLLAALSLGVQWKTQPQTLSAEAELWSAVPQEAAPKLVELPPEAPKPLVKAEPPTPPKPAKPAPPPAAPPEAPKADIVLAKEKLRLKKEKQEALEAQQQAQLKLEKAEKLKQDKLELQKQAKLDKEKAQAEAKKKTALEAKRKAALAAEQEQLENQKIEIQRADNLKRIAGLAGATGGAEAKGSALQASGPSPSYAGKLRARIKPNIVFTDDIGGNPTAEIEVRTSPDGTIVSRKLIKSSGVKTWDDAVLKAIDKTDALPRDTDGRVPSTLIITFRPKD